MFFLHNSKISCMAAFTVSTEMVRAQQDRISCTSNAFPHSSVFVGVLFVIQLSHRHDIIYTAPWCRIVVIRSSQSTRVVTVVSRTVRAKRKGASGLMTIVVCVYVFDLRRSRCSHENLMSKCHADLA